MTMHSQSGRGESAARHRSMFTGQAAGIVLLAVASACFTMPAGAQAPVPGARELPAKTIPVPDTVSPQMQKLIAAPLTPTWNVIPTTAAEWKAQVDAGAAAAMQGLPALRDALRVKVEPMTIDGVKAFLLTPETIPPENRNRLLVHVHGGCFVSFPGESGTGEAIYMAGFGRFKVISVDYRMPPDHPYPAALDDAMTVWKAASKMAPPKNMAIFGSSAGGNLTLAGFDTQSAQVRTAFGLASDLDLSRNQPVVTSGKSNTYGDALIVVSKMLQGETLFDFGLVG